MSIRAKLFVITGIAVLSLAAVFGVNQYGSHQLQRTFTAEKLALAAEKAVLNARRYEKDFIFRKDKRLLPKVNSFAEKAKDSFSELASLDASFRQHAGEGIALVDRYESLFRSMAGSLEKIGLTEKQGLRGELRGAVHTAEDAIRARNNDRLMSGLLMLRRHEKDYLLRKDPKYLKKFAASLESLKADVTDTPYLPLDVQSQIFDSLDKYEQAFRQLVSTEQDARRKLEEFTAVAHKIEPLTEALGEHALGWSKEIFQKSRMLVLGIEILAALGLLALAVFIIRSITSPLATLQRYARQVAEGDFSEVSAKGFSGELLTLHGDITRMVAELKKKLGFAEGILNGLTMPCAVIGTDRRIEWTNAEMLDLWQKKGRPEDFLGQKSGQFFLGDASQITISDRALEQQRTIREEAARHTDDGREMTLDITATPFSDMDGNCLGALAVIFDLSDIRRQQRLIEEQNLRIARAAAEATQISDEVASAAEELSAQIEQSSHGAEEQRSRTAEVATAIEEMNATVMEVSRNAAQSAGISQNARERAEEGVAIVGDVVRTIDTVNRMAEKLKSDMADLGQKADGIGDIMSVINDIADQTNLLALNAAIEAARAGDAGRGFAVVADEVRKLAEKTMQATGEVGEYIESIQQSARDNVKATEDTTRAIGTSTESAHKAEETLNEIMRLIEEAADQGRNIATASEQQSAASEQIARSTDEINVTAAETSQAMLQSAQAVTELARLAGELKNIITAMQAEN